MRKFRLKVRSPKSIPDKHALSIARKTMNLSCIGCLCMGGPDHYAAAETIHRLTGVFVNIEAGCSCKRAAVPTQLGRSVLEAQERAWARGVQS